MKNKSIKHPLEVGQFVSWKRRGQIISGTIMSLWYGDLIGSTNKHPGLHHQPMATVQTQSGECVKVDSRFLTKKESGLK